ncbi:MAG: hypothetical protein ACRDK8_13735 [Solirubrobacteraceae bacterium]
MLAVPLVGRFEGRCVPGARRWTLRFIDDTGINDFVYYRFGSGPRRKVNLRSSGTLTWRLRPGAFRSHEPADPLTNTSATTVSTTTPLSAVIIQGSEPHIFRLDVTLALASAIGDTSHCAPVASSLRALTYFNGGQPAIP